MTRPTDSAAALARGRTADGGGAAEHDHVVAHPHRARAILRLIIFVLILVAAIEDEKGKQREERYAPRNQRVSPGVRMLHGLANALACEGVRQARRPS